MKCKNILLLYLIVMSLFVLTACGTSKNNVDETANTSVEDKTTSNTENANQKQVAQTKITKEEAEEIAFKHAGVSRNDVTGVHTEYDVDDGVNEYDVDFYHNSVEYEYEINADNGTIITYETDK